MAKALQKKPGLAKTGAKPGKAEPAKGKTKTPKVPKFDDGATVEFVGYANKNDNPIYQPGDRLIVVSTEQNQDKQDVLNTVKEADYAAYQANPDDEAVVGDQVFPTEVKKAEKAKEDPYAIKVIHIGRVDELLTENGDDPLAAYNALGANIQESFFYQGAMLAELYSGKKFLEYGDYEDEKDGDKVKHGSGFDKFVKEQTDMGGARKALAAIQVYQRFAAIPDFDPATLDGLGWVKMQIMANSVTADNVEELVEKANEHSTEDFREVVRTDYVEAREAQGTARQSGPKVKRTTFTFKLFEDAGDGVQIVLDEAKKSTGLAADDQLFERIIMEWARDHLETPAFGKARKAKKAKLAALKKSGHDTTELVAADAALNDALNPEAESEAAAA